MTFSVRLVGHAGAGVRGAAGPRAALRAALWRCRAPMPPNAHAGLRRDRAEGAPSGSRLRATPRVQHAGTVLNGPEQTRADLQESCFRSSARHRCHSSHLSGLEAPMKNPIERRFTLTRPTRHDGRRLVQRGQVKHGHQADTPTLQMERLGGSSLQLRSARRSSGTAAASEHPSATAFHAHARYWSSDRPFQVSPPELGEAMADDQVSAQAEKTTTCLRGKTPPQCRPQRTQSAEQATSRPFNAVQCS